MTMPERASAPSVPVLASDLEGEAADYVAASRSPNTRRAYAADWRHFEAWCWAAGVEALPADAQTVALYITDLARWAKPATIRRRLSTIAVAHRAAGVLNPTDHLSVSAVWMGIRRTKSTAPEAKAPALSADVVAMVEALPDNLIGRRDRALLLIGLAAALRRSELVALDVRDVEERNEGLAITIRRSKADQEGVSRVIGIPYGRRPASCPVRSLGDWLEASAIVEGPLFRSVTRHGSVSEARLSDRAVALVVKRSAERVGLDPMRFGGHSLRSGFATSAAAAGATERAIMDQTGHRSVTMVRRYIRDGRLFHDNAAGRLDL